MRLAHPEGYEPSYRSPGFPFLHFVGAIASFAIIIQDGDFARLSALVLLFINLLWYYI